VKKVGLEPGVKQRGCQNETKFGRLIDGGVLYIAFKIGEL